MASRQMRLCPHCECSVSKKAYATHKRLYYNNDTNKWIKKRRLIPDEHLSLLTETELGMEECDYAFDTCNENLSDTKSSSKSPPPMFNFISSSASESCEMELDHDSDEDRITNKMLESGKGWIANKMS